MTAVNVDTQDPEIDEIGFFSIYDPKQHNLNDRDLVAAPSQKDEERVQDPNTDKNKDVGLGHLKSTSNGPMLHQEGAIFDPLEPELDTNFEFNKDFENFEIAEFYVKLKRFFNSKSNLDNDESKNVHLHKDNLRKLELFLKSCVHNNLIEYVVRNQAKFINNAFHLTLVVSALSSCMSLVTFLSLPSSPTPQSQSSEEQDQQEEKDKKSNKKKRKISKTTLIISDEKNETLKDEKNEFICFIFDSVIEILSTEQFIKSGKLDYLDCYWLLSFLIQIFSLLDNTKIRAKAMKLVNIGIFNCLSEHCLKLQLQNSDERVALLNKYNNKFNAAKKQEKQKLENYQKFLSLTISIFLESINSEILSIPSPTSSNSISATRFLLIHFCERVLELFIDLQAQLPTRRFFHILFCHDLVIPTLKSSLVYSDVDVHVDMHVHVGLQGTEKLRKLGNVLEFYRYFQIDEISGLALTRQQVSQQHHERLSFIQKMCFIKYPKEQENIIYASIGSLSNTKSLFNHLNSLSYETLNSFCIDIGARIIPTWPLGNKKPFETKQELINVVVDDLKLINNQLDVINSCPLYPDEELIYDESVLPNNNVMISNHTMPIPKLNIQFLTLHDYLLRNFQLYKLEAAFGIRQDINDAIFRMDPKFNPDGSNVLEKTVFTGWSRMATPLHQIQIENVGVSRLTETVPSFVKADITYNVSRFRGALLEEWDSLRPYETLYLVTIEMQPDMSVTSRQHGGAPNGNASSDDRTLPGSQFKLKYGVKYIRGCQIFQILGNDGEPVYDFASAKAPSQDGQGPRITGDERALRVLLDVNQYESDLTKSQGRDAYKVYGTFNLLVRRHGAQNNSKAVLETIRDLMQSQLVVPEWMHDILLGYGNRTDAVFTNMDQPTTEIDFGFTFISYQHLLDSFPDLEIVPVKNALSPELEPPFKVKFPKYLFSAFEEESHNEKSVLVSSYRVCNLIESPKINEIRFTRAQIHAIQSGSSKGLTMIVGPPGTGKTDVAVQIISNLYHQNPGCHMLLITRSNQALNHLFEKIAKANIDAQHLLRLGHGHDGVELAEWGKSGRTNSFLELRERMLAKVALLARTMEMDETHGATCETSLYFYTAHVEPKWDFYNKNVVDKLEVEQEPRMSNEEKKEKLKKEFPFPEYLHEINTGLLENCQTYEEARLVVSDFQVFLVDLFQQLEQLRPFELLRNNRERSNYVLVKEARIIAMTSTHASLKRRELVRLGFRYDSVIMEEAGQMLEVETFIPLLLQSHDTDLHRSRLQRIVLIGDHHQLPPIVQSQSLSRYSNMDQSLFTRLIRLGVPTVHLDYQGRARTSLADLYRWNYTTLGDLPLVQQRVEFQTMNSGFGYEYQAINVGEFKGQGETCPRPYFVQNLGEAEYVVATYMYMRLLGYPSDKIAILTTYNGQKELIRQILFKRCQWHPFFEAPKISTVDQFQGQQADYVLLSLVRTKTVGHFRDIRRLIVSLSRARLGLYVFCRVALFERCFEISSVFGMLKKRPLDLRLVENEVYGDCVRKSGDAGRGGNVKTVTDLLQMGKIVHDMTKSLKQ